MSCISTMQYCRRRPTTSVASCSKKPVAMLRPGDAQDIAKLVQYANRRGLKVAMRGQAHSFFGQTQVEGGVVIDSSSLNSIRIVKSGTGGTAEIGAGSKWHPVLMAANAQKLTVPVIADTFLSVGGTISTGGFGVTTYNLGLQVDHVQELEVVTGEGQIVTCSDAQQQRSLQRHARGPRSMRHHHEGRDAVDGGADERPVHQDGL